MRDRLGEQEDQFFATVFFGSGLLFLAMLFVSSAVTGGLILIYSRMTNPSDNIAAAYTLGYAVAREILNNYGIRMAGVFMISTCTLFLRTGTIPRWMVWLGYGFAVIMLFRIGHIERLGWVTLLFSLWVLLISVYILVEIYTRKSENFRGSAN